MTPPPMTSAERHVVAAGVVGTTASVYPAFLTGAVSVQLFDELGLSNQAVGIAIGCFFAGAAVGSTLLGALAERLGGARAMRWGLSSTFVSALTVAAFARSSVAFWLLLLSAGVSNALTQPAANLLLADGLHPNRLGTAFAIKQSGMPMATLLGGLAVPALALTIGWPGAYVAGAGLALVAWVVLARIPSGHPDAGQTIPTRRVPDMPLGRLRLHALLGGLGAAAAGCLVGFLVSGAERSGISAGNAGLLLTAGSVIGVTSRLLHGRLADRTATDQTALDPMRRAALLFAGGSVGFAVLAADVPTAYLLGIVPGFGAGWAWPGLFNLAIVRANPTAPGAATGVTQSGVYAGAGLGPALGGVLVDQLGVRWLWATGAAALLLAAALAAKLSDDPTGTEANSNGRSAA